MSDEEESALNLILAEMDFCKRFYDQESEIYAEISAALKIWGVTDE